MIIWLELDDAQQSIKSRPPIVFESNVVVLDVNAALISVVNTSVLRVGRRWHTATKLQGALYRW